MKAVKERDEQELESPDVENLVSTQLKEVRMLLEENLRKNDELRYERNRAGEEKEKMRQELIKKNEYIEFTTNKYSEDLKNYK